MANEKIVYVTVPSIDYLNVNVRDKNRLDVAGMVGEILATNGVIQEPLQLFKPTKAQREERGMTEELVVLRGNRRLAAARTLLADPATPQEVVKNLQKIPAIVRENMTWAEAEDFVIDHSQQMSLCIAEIVGIIFKLFAAGYQEAAIALKLYTLILKNCIKGGNAKLDKISKMPNGLARDNQIKSDCHTYLNLILTAPTIGYWLQEQVLLYHKSQDGLLATGEVKHLDANTPLLQKVRAAKTLDLKNNTWRGPIGSANITDSGVTFDPAEGGDEVNKCLEEHIVAAKTGAPVEKKPSSKTIKQLEDAKGSFRSKVFQAGLDFASGKTSETYVKIDQEEYLRDQKLQFVAGCDFVSSEVKAMIVGLVNVSLGVEAFKEVVKPLLKS